MRLSKAEVRDIYPVHEVRDEAKYETIKASMIANGWQGRPILVVDCGNYYQALTGSHRLAAATDIDKEAEVPFEVPIAIADTDKLYDDSDYWYIDNTLNELDYFVEVLREYDADAADLLDQDIDNDY
jgi:ParB-like chromosome segregation protein Spo0J